MKRLINKLGWKIPTCAIGLLTLIVTGWVLRGQLQTPGVWIEIDFDDATGISHGSAIEVNGIVTGEVRSVALLNGRTRVRAFLSGDQTLLDRLCQSGAEFYIENIEVKRGGEAVAANRALPGAAIRANFPRIRGEPCHLFQGKRGNYLPPGEDLIVKLRNTHGLESRAIVKIHLGSEIGRVVDIQPLASGGIVTFRVFDSKNCLESIAKSSTELCVETFRFEGLEARGESRAISGAALVVVLGDPNSPECRSFDCPGEEPPHPKWRWNSVRHTVSFPDLRGLKPRTPVLIGGVEEGVVETVISRGSSGEASIAFFDDSIAAKAKRRSTNWYLELVSVNLLGSRGNPATAYKGPVPIAVIDPLDQSKEILSEAARGEVSDSPRYRHDPREERIWVRSPSFVPPDRSVKYHKGVIGFVKAVEPKKDGSGFWLDLRIYPYGLKYFWEGSELALEQNVAINFGDGIAGVTKPKVDVPSPEAILEPGIEVFTPPHPRCGKPYKFNSSGESSFTVANKPAKDWLDWGQGVPSAEGYNQFNFDEIRTRSISLTWEKTPRWRNARKYFSGRALIVPGGVIALRELVEPEIGLGSGTFYVSIFKVNDKDVAYAEPPNAVLGEEIRFNKISIDGEPCTPLTRLGSIDTTEDLAVIVSDSDWRTIRKIYLTKSDNGRLIIENVAELNASTHGSPVVARSGPAAGKVIGLLDSRGNEKFVRLFVKNPELLCK